MNGRDKLEGRMTLGWKSLQRNNTLVYWAHFEVMSNLQGNFLVISE
jgi:hypothetical protein